MLGGMARRQDLHSQKHGKGNFAPVGLMDWIHGTGAGADVVDDMKDEADKHNVKGRGAKALDNAKESGREGMNAFKGRRKNPKRG
jgi:hypothetical protein